MADLDDNRALLQSEASDSEIAQMAREEIARLEAEGMRLALEVQRGILPPDPADSRNTIVEIRAGAGGSESALFAADLYRMYSRYAESRGWKLETLDSSPSDLGGFKEVIFSVRGADVFLVQSTCRRSHETNRQLHVRDARPASAGVHGRTREGCSVGAERHRESAAQHV